jgi:hypothetical protein
VLAEQTAELTSGDVAGPVSAASGDLLSCGAEAARFLAAAGDGLDDLMVTSRRAYHLVRQVESGLPEPVLVYLCLDRGRGNLALARRELAATRLGERADVPAQALPPVAERTGAAPTVAVPPAPATAPPAAGPPAARRPSPVPRGGGRVAVPLPRRSPAALPPPAPPRPRVGAGWSDDVGTMRRLLDGLRRLP